MWVDYRCMQRLVTSNMPKKALQPERDCFHERVRRFVYNNGLLHRVFTDGSKREVPRPSERADIIKRSHDDAGHFGIKRTVFLFAIEYW